MGGLGGGVWVRMRAGLKIQMRVRMGEGGEEAGEAGDIGRGGVGEVEVEGKVRAEGEVGGV
jgi:hypothetical protein